MAQLNYIELPVASTARSIAFYKAAFGWKFNEYGGEYAAHEDAPCELALNGTEAGRSDKILPIIEVQDLEAARASVIESEGQISADIYAYPGGRRFHFTDPDGLELAVYQKEG